MNRIFKVIGALSLAVLFGNCQKDDGLGSYEARPHSEVYPEDLADIEDYLHKAYVEVSRNGNGDVTNVKIDTLDTTHTVSIWDQTDYPLLTKIVKLHGVEYKVYYLKLDSKGDTDADGDKPCGVDRVLTSYKGMSIIRTLVKDPVTNVTHSVFGNKQFDYAPNPVAFNLIDLVKGWEYIMPEFRAGYFDATGGDGTLNPRNYGSGVMFLPSGLGYYSLSSTNIPSYTPIVFSFNLHAVTYLDQDFDKIPSRYEYSLNADGTLLDTDGDGVPNVFDGDDDNDGHKTIDEIKKPSPYLGSSLYYPFDPVVDNPLTPSVDESEPKGIPDASGDGTTATRVRRHLDKNAKPPYTVY